MAILQYSCLENSMDREAWWVQSMGSQRVGHDLAPNTHTHIHTPLQCLNVKFSHEFRFSYKNILSNWILKARGSRE